jgi:glycosyltransferase involved in cell wall biosynthesis
MSIVKKNLLIISELFPPEETSTGYIMGEIANKLSKTYNVTVICGPNVYDKDRKLDHKQIELNDSIKIIRVPGIKENKKKCFSRIKKFGIISFRLYTATKKKIKGTDKVLMVSNPFPLIVMMAYLRKRHSFELTMLVHDVFPESLYTEINIPNVIYKIAQYIFNRAYASVDKMITLGRDMTDVMTRKTVLYNKNIRMKQIENWGDIHAIKMIDYEAKDSIVIEYAGNVGRAQGVSKFMHMIEKTNSANIKFSIWGSGSETEYISKYIGEHNLKNIELHGAYLRSQQTEILGACDIALITLVDGMYGLGVPSKAYNILASGRAILFIGPLNSEIAIMVKENNIGFCFSPYDQQGIQDFLKSLNIKHRDCLKEMGKRARQLAETKYSKECILDKFAQFV